MPTHERPRAASDALAKIHRFTINANLSHSDKLRSMPNALHYDPRQPNNDTAVCDTIVARICARHLARKTRFATAKRLSGAKLR